MIAAEMSLDVTHVTHDIAVQLQPLLGFYRIVVHAFGLDGARRDTIEANTELGPLESQRLHHREHAAARGCGMHEATQAGADASGDEDDSDRHCRT